MKKTAAAWIGILLVSAATLACSFSNRLVSRVVPETGTDILFQDDFSDPESGWTTRLDENLRAEYRGGSFHFFVNEPQMGLGSTPELDFTDMRVNVDAFKAGGPDDNQFGVICRYVDENNFYALLISSDGYFGITRVKDGEAQLLGRDQMEISKAIHTGGLGNHVQAECVGDRLTLWANGTLLDEVHDDAFTRGDVGLWVGTFDEAGADVLFDDFIVRKPTE